MQIGQFVSQGGLRSTRPFSRSRCLWGSAGTCCRRGYPLVVGNMSRELGILPSPLELQSSDIGGKASNNTGHLPWSQTDPRSAHSAAFDLTVVLSQSPLGVWRRSYIETRMSDSGAEEVTTIKSWDGLHVHGLADSTNSKELTCPFTIGLPETSTCCTSLCLPDTFAQWRGWNRTAGGDLEDLRHTGDWPTPWDRQAVR